MKHSFRIFSIQKKVFENCCQKPLLVLTISSFVLVTDPVSLQIFSIDIHLEEATTRLNVVMFSVFHDYYLTIYFLYATNFLWL